MKRKKKSTKAVTLLTRIETLLSDVLHECSAIEETVEKQVRSLLASAAASIAEAKDFVLSLPPSSEGQEKASKSRKPRRQRPALRSKTRPSLRAKKRSAA